MSSEIRAFSVFKTFPLIACFLGLGAGYASSKDKLFRATGWASLLFALTIKIVGLSGIGLMPFPSLGVLDWLNTDSTQAETWFRLGIFSIALPITVLAPFFLMMCVGARLGALFGQFKPLSAYGVNIAGAVFGGICFSILSFFCLSPGILVVLPALCVSWYLFKTDKKKVFANSLVLASTVILMANPDPSWAGGKTLWSPYQRIDLVPITVQPIDLNKKPIKVGDCLYVNRAQYQATLDWKVLDENKKSFDSETVKLCTLATDHYRVPASLAKPKDVLVVGAGMGNDAAYLLEMLSPPIDIDVVDIDPVILNLGKLYHPAHPYDSPNVHMVCNDARNYFNRCNKKYDMVVLGNLDSHAVSAGASLRLDNFVYTRESFATILKLLNPGGLAVTSFTTKKTWFKDRLYKTISEAIGYKPLELQYRNKSVANTIFVFGDPVKKGDLKVPQEVLNTYDVVQEHENNDTRALTDDWPYLYVIPNSVDLPYLAITVELILMAVLIGKSVFKTSQSRPNWQMFFLGAAFMLLELQCIAKLSLIYGSTWLTTSVTVNLILVMILLANFAVIKFRNFISTKLAFLYAALVISLVVSYMSANITDLFGQSNNHFLPLLITLLTVLPVLLASIIFSSSFAEVASPKDAMAINLFGAFLGGLFEYSSNYTGINNLLWLVTIFYTLSFLAYHNSQKVNA